MRAYPVKAINVGSFALGETDKVLTLFSLEKGIIRAVAKGARKPGSKIAGRADVLNVNQLLLAPGKTFEIISQAQSLETFSGLRKDLARLSYGLYYAELTHHFGHGLEDDSESYFQELVEALSLQARAVGDAALLCLSFELRLLERLGYKPELDYCVICRKPLTDYKVDLFHHELGGIVCSDCVSLHRTGKVRERERRRQHQHEHQHEPERQDENWSTNDRLSPIVSDLDSPHSVQITPLVWKRLIRAEQEAEPYAAPKSEAASGSFARSSQAARRVIQSYIEHKAGKRMKSLDLLGKI